MAAKGIFLFNFLCICMRSYSSLVETDTITQGQQLLDYQHLVSAGGIFKLGFFSPRNSKHRYLGIWYKEDRDETVVWVANGNIPIMDTSGVLTIDGNGNLKIVRGEETLIVLNSNKATTNSTATLEDNGNFIMREVNSKQVLWQSFDYPTNTLLPGMKLGVNFKTGHRWSLVSWLSSEVPASGAFTLGGDPNGTSQLFMWQRGDLYWTSGVWSNGSFEFLRMYRYLLEAHERFQMQYISEEDEKYITYSVKDGSNSRWVMELSGKIMDHQQQIGTSAVCDGYSSDGGCLGPKLPECRSQYTFRKEIGGMNVQPEIWGNLSLGLSDCYAECMSNCSCVAYGSRYRNGTGCMFWSRGSSFEGFTAGNEVYVDKGIGSMSGKAGAKILEGKYWWIWFCFAIAVALVILLLDSLYRSRRKLRIEVEKDANELVMLFSELETNVTTFDNLTGANEVNKDGKGHDLKVFSFACIMAATNNFANENKLGEGGFGPVYKGKLHEGWEIAVKRLSRSSGQGLIEFKNEIILISKLQHMNLVKLFGCCIQGEEKMLIYEFMPNKSLDFFLFDPSKREHLNWKKRFNIIEGIAQGLLYLHKYSRLRIIHRDLKASNILLDDDMNPKISDFGMARIFGRNASEANTNRIVGTYGYMSPEYAMEGIFSVKSDVFSFGVLLLEIVSGRKNNSFYDPHHPLTIIGYTWEMWKEGTILELMDPTLGASCPKHEVLRCIHVGLLCVQENAIDRPNMSNVASMLSNETIPLPPPKQPAFFTGRSIIEADLSKAKAEKYSINGLSISVLEAR